MSLSLTSDSDDSNMKPRLRLKNPKANINSRSSSGALFDLKGKTNNKNNSVSPVIPSTTKSQSSSKSSLFLSLKKRKAAQTTNEDALETESKTAKQKSGHTDLFALKKMRTEDEGAIGSKFHGLSLKRKKVTDENTPIKKLKPGEVLFADVMPSNKTFNKSASEKKQTDASAVSTSAARCVDIHKLQVDLNKCNSLKKTFRKQKVCSPTPLNTTLVPYIVEPKPGN